MDFSAWLGIGLTAIGAGLPSAVALAIPLLKMWLNSKYSKSPCPVREHEARMGKIEQDVARLQENFANITTSLLRIENKLNGRITY